MLTVYGHRQCMFVKGNCSRSSDVLGAEVSSEIKCHLISPSQAAQTALMAL